MSVSPADFELYSRATGAPLPRTPEERMKMAPEVHNFVRSQGYAKKPDIYREIIRPTIQGLVLGQALNSAYGAARAGGTAKDVASAWAGGSGVNPVADVNVGVGSPPSREPIDVSWSQVGNGPAQLPPGGRGGDIVRTSQNPSPQMPSPGDNVGSVGTITKDLNTGAVPTNTFNVSGDGFNYNPGYYRQQADGLGSMAPINWPDASKNDPLSFAVKTGGAVAGAGLQNAGTIATQGYYDLLKGGGDLITGAQHAKTTIDGVYNWGASARKWHDNTLVPWHDNKLVPAVKSFANAPTNVFGVPIDNAHLSVRHPDVLPGERSHNLNHNIHRDVNRYPNDEPGVPVSNVYENISAANLPTRANAVSGLGREGVPVGAIPSLRMGDIRTTDESASLSPKGDLIATNLQGVPDPVNALWYGGQKPTQNALNEAAANLRRKYADVYESQGISGDVLPDDERISGWQGQGGGSEGLAGTASGVINYDPAPGYGQQRSVQPVVSPVPQRSLEQDAIEHFGSLGGVSFAPKSTSVSRFAMSPEMMVDTSFVKTPEKRYTKDLATSDYVANPSAIPEINPATLAAIEQDVRDEAVDSGLSVLQEMADVERTGQGAGDLANRITRSREFKNKPGYYTYRTEADPWL